MKQTDDDHHCDDDDEDDDEEEVNWKEFNTNDTMTIVNN